MVVPRGRFVAMHAVYVVLETKDGEAGKKRGGEREAKRRDKHRWVRKQDSQNNNTKLRQWNRMEWCFLMV